MRRERRHVPLKWLKLNLLLFPYCITVTWMLLWEAVLGLRSVRKFLPSTKSTKMSTHSLFWKYRWFQPTMETHTSEGLIIEINYSDFTHWLHKKRLRAVYARGHAKHLYNTESILDTALNGQTCVFCKPTNPPPQPQILWKQIPDIIWFHPYTLFFNRKFYWYFFMK